MQWTITYNFDKIPFSQARPIANEGTWEKATYLLPRHHASLVEKLSWVKMPMSCKKKGRGRRLIEAMGVNALLWSTNYKQPFY